MDAQLTGPGDPARYPIESMKFSIFLLGLFLSLVSDLNARPVDVPTHAELLARSNLIIVVRPVATRDAKAGDPIVRSKRTNRDYLVPVVTRFRVLAVLKGDFKETELLLPHYRLDLSRSNVSGIGNGPQLVTFPALNQADPNVADPIPYAEDRILYLVREPDGSPSFVTGQFDPAFSVLRVSPSR